MKNTIAQKLKFFRDKFGLTQAELADILTEIGKNDKKIVTQEDLNEWEQGASESKMITLSHILIILSATANYDLVGTNPKEEILLECEKYLKVKEIRDEHVWYKVYNGILELCILGYEEYTRVEIFFYEFNQKEPKNEPKLIGKALATKCEKFSIPKNINFFVLHCYRKKTANMKMISKNYYIVL